MKKPPLLLRVGVLTMFILLIAGFIAYRTDKLDGILNQPDNKSVLLANSINQEHLLVDSPAKSPATYPQQSQQHEYYTKRQSDSLNLQDSMDRANELRLSSSKSMYIPKESISIKDIKQLPMRTVKDVPPVYLGTSKSAPVIQPYRPAQKDTIVKQH